jgi:hypothetical protein
LGFAQPTICSVTIPKDKIVLLLYTNYFEDQFGFMLRDKSPETPVEVQEQPTKIQKNLLNSRVEPFHTPYAKDENNLITLHNVEPANYPREIIIQRLKKMTNELSQYQNLLMSILTNIERTQQNVPPRPPYNNNRQKRGNMGWKPRPPNEQRAPNTIVPTNFINQEVVPWCFPCGDAHWEHE